MADLFLKQAEEYAKARPSYPTELFQFIASKTPSHELAWDVGTGSGQAAKHLAGIYNNVIGTDTSEKQLEFATKLPNVKYQHTPSIMSMEEVEHKVAAQGSVDLVTIAQALHWFDLPSFYKQVKWVLKKPNGVIAAICYDVPRVSDEVDKVFDEYYEDVLSPYWESGRKFVEDNYRSIDFPFLPVDGADHTGPFEFVSEVTMDLESYLTFMRSSSAYQTAKDKGVELLGENLLQKFKDAWGHNGSSRVAKFPLFVRIGRVGDA